jgi:hypothetical protein
MIFPTVRSPRGQRDLRTNAAMKNGSVMVSKMTTRCANP